jgi:hypothetical protein
MTVQRGILKCGAETPIREKPQADNQAEWKDLTR